MENKMWNRYKTKNELLSNVPKITCLCSVASNSWWRLCPWDFPSRNTRVGSHFLLRDSSWPRDQTRVSCVSYVGWQILYHQATRQALRSIARKEWQSLASHPDSLASASTVWTCLTEQGVGCWPLCQAASLLPTSVRMFPQSSGRPDQALSWVRQRRCYQWQLWGHSREEFVLCYFFQHLVKLEWLVSQHLWLCRKAPRQWRPSKSVSLPARPYPPFPLKSFGLLCPWPDFERTNHQYWMRADISEEEYQQMFWDRSADWIRAACEVWHQSPLQRAARQSTPAGPGQSRPVASR